MIKDFSIKHACTLISANGQMDLHNDVDLERVVVSRQVQRIEMFWCPSPFSLSQDRLRISFESVKRFIISSEGSDNRSNAPLSHIGYVASKDFGIVEPFLLEESFDADSTMVLYFDDESFILIDARVAHAIIDPHLATVAPIG